MAIRTFFNPPATDKAETANKISLVLVPMEVYRAYLWLYSCSFNMVKQMEKVLDDGHHQEILKRGPGLGYVMPDEAKIRATTKALREALESFDGSDAEFVKGRVRLPIATARGFYQAAMLSDRLIDEVFTSIRKSEYMLWLRALKVTGEEYKGPTSLQETVDVWVAFNDLNLRQIVYPTSRRGQKLQPGWNIQP